MAPNVQVPADFGKHHIGAPAHGNLIFKLKEGEHIMANSIILSLNSPVIDKLTTNLLQQSLDADDFHRDAVDCFIEAAYTGELENIKQSNFRDVNKMAHVFDVSWLSIRCAEYFKLLVEGLDMDEYEEILFVVEDARFVSSALKKRHFLEPVVDQMSSMATERNVFVERYMIDFIKFSKDRLDVAIEIVGVDVHVFVSILTSYLVENKDSIASNVGYLLENVNVSLCLKTHKDVFDSMFTALENIDNPTREDFKMMTKLSKLYVEKSVIPSKNISNLFYSIEQFIELDFEHLVDQLASAEEVSTFYMFFDAVRVWIYQELELGREGVIESKFNKHMLEKIITIKETRGWSPVASQYFDNTYSNSTTEKFVNLLKDSDTLVTRQDNCYLPGLQEFSSQEFSDVTFLTATQLKFRFNSRQYHNCTQKGDCGVILQISPERRNKSNVFDIRLCTEPSEYALDLHFHCDMVNASKIHIVLECQRAHSNWGILPLTWCGRPHCDETGKHWRWGHYRFHEKDVHGVWPDEVSLKTFDTLITKGTRYTKFRFAIFIDNGSRSPCKV